MKFIKTHGNYLPREIVLMLYQAAFDLMMIDKKLERKDVPAKIRRNKKLAREI